MHGTRLLALYSLALLVPSFSTYAASPQSAPGALADTLEALARVARSFQLLENEQAPDTLDSIIPILTKIFAKELHFTSEGADATVGILDEGLSVHQKQKSLMADMRSIAAAIDAGPAPSREEKLRRQMRELIMEYQNNLKDVLVTLLRSYGQKKEDAEANVESPAVSAILSYLQAAVIQRFREYT